MPKLILVTAVTCRLTKRFEIILDSACNTNGIIFGDATGHQRVQSPSSFHVVFLPYSLPLV